MKKNFFNSHLKDADMNYIQHMVRAGVLGVKSIVAAKVFFIHSLFPFLFKNTGGEIIKKLNAELENFEKDLVYKIRRGAVAIVLNKSGKALILKRSSAVGSFNGYWNFPAGAIDDGESEVEAAVRECYEESNIKIKEEDMNFLTKFRDHIADVDIYYFITNKYSGSPVINWESDDFLWLDVNSIFSNLKDEFVPIPKNLHILINAFINE